MKFSLKDAIRVAVLTEPGKKWPTYDGKTLNRHQYVTASEATNCARRLAFEKKAGMGAVYVENFWENLSDDEFNKCLDDMKDTDPRGIFARGNLIEEWIVRQLLVTVGPNEEYMLLGDEQRSFYSDKYRTSGTPDGLYLNHATKTWRVLEFKSTQNPVTAPKYAHVTQLRMNMGLIKSLAEEGKLDEPLDFPFSSYTLESGLLLYVDACNYLSIQEFEVEYDEGEAHGRAFEKAKKVFIKKDGVLHVREPAEVEPEGLNGAGNGCFFCTKKAECQAIEMLKQDEQNVNKLRELSDKAAGRSVVPAMPTFRSLGQSELVAVLANYARFKAQEKEAKKAADKLKPEIVRYWEEEGLRDKTKFQSGDDVVEWNYTTSVRKGGIDTVILDDFLINAGLENSSEDFRKADSVSTRLTVKVTPEDAYLNYDLFRIFATDEEEADEDVNE